MRIRRSGRDVLGGYDSLGRVCIQVALGRYISMDSAFGMSSNSVVSMILNMVCRKVPCDRVCDT